MRIWLESNARKSVRQSSYLSRKTYTAEYTSRPPLMIAIVATCVHRPSVNEAVFMLEIESFIFTSQAIISVNERLYNKKGRVQIKGTSAL